ncbi:hypothetical protein [Hymenobacter sp. B81]|uniref:hypothetical protein n=1 Tax=Hymenobacter sp. B81 TaxID=3344878 RepID=UPI0037DC106E
MSLINWRLLALHLLAAFFLTLAIDQFMLLPAADMLEVALRVGPKAVLLPAHWQDEWGPLITYLWYANHFPPLLAWLLASLLSWLVVARLGERRAIPALVLVLHLLITRLGLYDSDAVTALNKLPQHLAAPFSLATKFWVAGLLFTAVALLLLAAPLLFPKRQSAAPAA